MITHYGKPIVTCNCLNVKENSTIVVSHPKNKILIEIHRNKDEVFKKTISSKESFVK